MVFCSSGVQPGARVPLGVEGIARDIAVGWKWERTRNYITGSEGSQAVLVRTPGRSNAYD
jgi:hypothetical protein